MGERTAYLLERALLPTGVASDVLVEMEDGRFVTVEPASLSPADRGRARMSGERSPDKHTFPRLTGESDRVPGLALPGFANTHSHVFHRALRGRTQRERGSFWTWRDQMYDVAARLTPDDLRALARATYREMLAAGMTGVGEFHYLHHQPDGTPCGDHDMERAVVAGARDAGIRVALLDTCYLAGGFDAPVEGVQVRYADASADAWAERVAALEAALGSPPPEGQGHGPDVVVGAALHSVRAVPADQMATVVEAAGDRPLHVHVSEQTAEVEACLAVHGCTPPRLLAEHGVLGPTTTAVHATHLTDDDIRLLGESRTVAGFCPTTERDLGDGIGPGRALHEAGSPLSLGSDSHAVIDHFEEMRALEMHERLATRRRGHWSTTELVAAATRHDSIGFPDAGAIEVGRRADLVVVDTASPRTAGAGDDDHAAVFAATAADVAWTMVDGRVVFTADEREDVGRELAAVTRRLW